MMIIAARKNSRATKGSPLCGIDDMANTWGSSYVGQVGGEMATRIKFETLIRVTAVPGFLLGDVVESGTTANERAMSLATNGNYSQCLIGMGSYVGGAGTLEAMSSTKMEGNWMLSLIRDPEFCSPATRNQTVPLPYHVPHSKLDDTMIEKLEARCLQQLNCKLAHAAIQGTPCKAFLLECILSGNGGELTVRFLENFAALLARYKVSIIADEIMTGGRIGPTVAMTSTMSANFIKSVTFITMGKAFGCGLVLEKQKPMDDVAGNASRGTTTELELNEPYWNLQHIITQIARGVIDRKRERVLKKLNLSDHNQTWGRGLLMFSSKQRSKITTNLRNRLLPTLEDDPKTKFKVGFAKTSWNRVSITEHLLTQVNAWLEYSHISYEELNVSPYTVALSNYISFQPVESLEAKIIYPEDLVNFLELSGANTAEMIEQHNLRKKRKFGPIDGRCAAGHQHLIHGSLKEAAEKSNGFLTKGRKHKRRKMCFELQFGSLTMTGK